MQKAAPLTNFWGPTYNKFFHLCYLSDQEMRIVPVFEVEVDKFHDRISIDRFLFDKHQIQ